MRIIENITDDYAHCRDEQAFKKLYTVSMIKKRYSSVIQQKIFNVETEETVAGFPDVMELLTDKEATRAKFYEFKISDARGNIKFQPTQPAFYKNNSELWIRVIAYNRQTRRVHRFSPDEIFDKESPYFTMNGRVNLTAVEKEIGI